jgi:hypothetical protein
MALNKVQFQKGLSEAQFAVLYGTEDQCREAVCAGAGHPNPADAILLLKLAEDHA